MPESATLPSQSASTSPAAVQRTARWGSRIDFLQVVLVLVLAFLAGSLSHETLTCGSTSRPAV